MKAGLGAAHAFLSGKPCLKSYDCFAQTLPEVVNKDDKELLTPLGDMSAPWEIIQRRKQ